MKSKCIRTSSPGKAWPLGATQFPQGINFAIVSEDATAVTLCLISSSSDNKVVAEYPLDPKINKTGSVWHILLHDLDSPGYFAWKIDGPQEKGPFNKDLLLLDPYAREVSSTNIWGNRALRREYHPRGTVLKEDEFDWQGTSPLERPINETIIYEMHVRGFTQHPSSGVNQPGTYLAIIDKIPHLKSLGITALELLPIFEFNENEVIHTSPKTKKKLFQYWGYSTVNFFAPMNRYATHAEIGAATREFKTLVRELHRNGLEIILDVVYNHTAEGDRQGPILSFKGIDNEIYFMLEPDKNYSNFSGCGNTFNCNNPVVREFIIQSLRYWVQEMHVDGFRFDLASILQRGQKGQPLDPSPLIEAISQDPILAQTKLIAEPWDAGGLYQVGTFYSQAVRWQEWNGKYRDNVRKFIKGTPGVKSEFATRLCGSQDLYHNRTPTTSLNFVVAHDGFTLHDLVSYNSKHNEENGEENRDGANENESWNCGEEGHTQNKQIHDLRQKQMRNFHLALMVSLGVPMVHMGDEYCHTKNGNNNTWCQDNELNWYLWNRLSENGAFVRFFSMMNHLRLNNPLLLRDTFVGEKDIVFHGIEPEKPDWSPDNMFIAYCLISPEENHLYIAFNAKASTQIIEFPDPPANKSWHILVNTAAPSPKDIVEEHEAPALTSTLFKMQSYSALLLKAY